MTRRRAITDDQKLARRQALLDEAWTLFQQRTYDAINMLDVARAAGLAKGTVYLYFPTKEALFLALLEQQFAEWFDTIDAALAAPAAAVSADSVASVDAVASADAVAHLLADSIAQRPALARLFAIAHVVLEHNVDYEVARRYKRLLLDRVTHTGALLEQQLGLVPPGSGMRVLLRAYALVIGVEHLARPAPVAAQVIAEDRDLAVFQVDFRSELRALLRAVLVQAQQEHSPLTPASTAPDD